MLAPDKSHPTASDHLIDVGAAAPEAPQQPNSPPAPAPAGNDAGGSASQSPKAPPVEAEPAPKIDPTKEIEETVQAALTWKDQAVDFFQHHIATTEVAVQVVALLATGLLAALCGRLALQLIERFWPSRSWPRLNIFRRALEAIRIPLIWVLLLWSASAVLRHFNFDVKIITAVASLLNAWVVIRLFSSAIGDAFWTRAFAAFAWTVAALNILGLLAPTIGLLDSFAFTFGNARLSVYSLLKGVVFAGLLIWLASFLAKLIGTRIQSAEALTPSVQTMISQTVRLGLLFGAIIIALSAIGVDLTALAVFSGAVGVGIGFGLQSVFSNLVAGIILLFERSIKVGDFVELTDGIQGTVREITIRSTLVTTNDNIDVLVPNSEFITKQMTNWTLRDAYRRLRIPFGVAYGTDKDLVRKAVLEAAGHVEHTLTHIEGREPRVWLVGFGDSSLDFELVVWLRPEAVVRPSAVNADYCWEIETALSKYDIEIPFPQRDLHIRSGTLKTRMLQDDEGGAGTDST